MTAAGAGVSTGAGAALGSASLGRASISSVGGGGRGVRTGGLPSQYRKTTRQHMNAATPRTVGKPSSKSDSGRGSLSPGISSVITGGSFTPQRHTSIFGGTRRPHDGHSRLAIGLGEIGDIRAAVPVVVGDGSPTPTMSAPHRHTSILRGTRRPQEGHTRLDGAESRSDIPAMIQGESGARCRGGSA